jgi:type IV secretory pathway VirB2 component (pilin)
MKPLLGWVCRFRAATRGLGIAVVSLALAVPAFGQGTSPWESAVNVLQQAFTSTIARGLACQSECQWF